MEDPDDKFFKFCICLLIFFLLATGFLFGWIARGMWEGSQAPEEKHYQFYDTCYASWQAPKYQEEEIEAVLTAYNPVWWQTDDTPHLTASQKLVKEGMMANNCLPFGTLIEYEGKTYVIEDRMNKSKGCECFDILMFNLEEARNFGKKVETINAIILN